MRFAILGGSFNPVHLGHLFLAETVLLSLAYDRIILVPAFRSPFKPGEEGASVRDRLDMLAASIPGDSRLTIDDGEIRREGVSYTIDTLMDLNRRYRPEGKPGLILGDDLAGDFPRWKKAGQIACLADIILARRVSAQEVSFPYPHTRLDNGIMEISSNMVRDRVRNRENWRYLVPEGARIIIEDRLLYGFVPSYPENSPPGGEPLRWHTVIQVEKAAQSMMSPSRFLHSRNTALLAADLCRRYGLDPKAGYLAGVSHDICKSFPDEKLLRIAASGDGEISKLEQKKPSILHARAAAVLLRERFDIHNKDILDAVRFHTTGGAEMGPLAKIVYIADKIEVSREVPPELRGLSREAGLDQLFTAVLEATVAYLRSRKQDLSEGTLRLLETIHKRRVL